MNLIALLDKEYPPNHSFVDGMLATELPKEKNINITLLVSQSSQSKKKVYKYKKSLCLPILLPRKGLKRFLNFFISIRYIYLLSKREHKKGNETVLFVRNDPVYLFACALMKKKKQQLIFQSSFPHEEVSGGKIKRWVAKNLYQISAFGIDSLLTVSPVGLRRVNKLFPKVKKRDYIPLLAQDNHEKTNNLDIGKKVKFIYIGSHAKSRKLEIVFQAIAKAMEYNIYASFEFIGGKEQEIEAFLQTNHIKQLCNEGALKFTKFIPRDEIWYKLRNADIGLCLIPPDPHYLEASPTKLTEYMQIGLAILASNGIELQEEFILASNGGVLVDWDVEKIADAIVDMTKSKKTIIGMKRKSLHYTKESLNYKKYTSVMRKLMFH